MQPDQFNIEAFKALRDEIKFRLDIHYKLMFAKFAGIGALFAFLVGNSTPVPAYATAAIFAFILDIVVLENLGHIRLLGSYIKQRIENTPANIVKWESEAAQKGVQWRCFSFRGYFIGVGALGYFLYAGHFIFDFRGGGPTEQAFLVAATYFGTYVLILMYRHLKEPYFIDFFESPIRMHNPAVHRTLRDKAAQRR